MRGIRTFGWLIIALAVIAPALAVSPIVTVSFENPAGYTDAGLRYGKGPNSVDSTLRGIRAHLEQLGNRYLQPGQELKLDVLDIDLAGQFEPWRPRAYDVRVMRGVTRPKITVRYVLEQGGEVVSRGEDVIRDMNYQMQVGTGYSNDSLRYEKLMLDEWFKARFAPAQGQSASR